jgi:hypothetical protein
MGEYQCCVGYGRYPSDCERVLSAVDSTVLLDRPSFVGMNRSQRPNRRPEPPRNADRLVPGRTFLLKGEALANASFGRRVPTRFSTERIEQQSTADGRI